MTDQPKPQGQLDVQRWLGRCMLRLQQYERLMKTPLAHHELAWPADTLETQRAANLEKVSDKTLGTLVKLVCHCDDSSASASASATLLFDCGRCVSSCPGPSRLGTAPCPP